MVETSSAGLAAASIDYQSASQFLEDFCARNCLDHISQLFHLCCAGDKSTFPGFSALRFISESDINAACAANELPLNLPMPVPLSQFRNKSATPWFDVYRRKFFISAGNSRTSETDTFLHPLACIYAVCSHGMLKNYIYVNIYIYIYINIYMCVCIISHYKIWLELNPIESLTKTQVSFPPFMDPNPLKIFLLIDFQGSNVE